MGDKINKACVGAAVFLEIVAFALYCRQIVAGAVSPALATWLICALATTLSLATYLAANKGEKPAIANIANRVDPVVLWIVVMVITLSSKSDIRFGAFDTACLAAASFVVVIWVLTHSARTANLLIQLIMIAGYLPTFHRLFQAGRNTESFASWGINLAVCALYLVPPIRKRDSLAIVYSVRAIVCVAAVLAAMMYLQFF
jgi:hypothetical protein